MPGSVYSKSFRATSFARISEVMSARAMLTNDAPIFGPHHAEVLVEIVMLHHHGKTSHVLIEQRRHAQNLARVVIDQKP